MGCDPATLNKFMAITDQSSSPAVAMAQLVPQLLSAYDQLVYQMTVMGQRVYGAGPDAAVSNVQAMGTNAVSIYTLAGLFQTAINQAAPMVGRKTISVMPDGYSFAGNSDGTGALTYVDPNGSTANVDKKTHAAKSN